MKSSQVSKMYEVIKRLLDIVVASMALLVLVPLFLFLAIAVYATDGGPIFYTQERVGRSGRRFRFLKFRSMMQNADALLKELACKNETGGIIFKMRNDPRITPIGRWMRRFSLDELPQLVHVLTGDMTLVGPRPPKPEEVEQYRVQDLARLSVAQGLTCLWQVSGRSELPFDKQVELDVKYIRERGYWTDLRILVMTIPAVLGGKGAY